MDNNKVIKIGTDGSNIVRNMIIPIAQQLSEQGFRTEEVMLNGADEKRSFTEMSGKSLLESAADLAILPLNELSTSPFQGLRIGAISARINPVECLVIRKEAFRPGNELFLDKEAVIGHWKGKEVQLLQLKPDAVCKEINTGIEESIDLLHQAEINALLVSAAMLEWNNTNTDAFEVIMLNPREYVPAAGQGVPALQLRTDDAETLKAVRTIHNAAVHETVSVERKVQKLLADRGLACFGVYCEKDKQNNFHVWAAVPDVGENKVKRLQLSSSTSFELAETLLQELIS